MKLDMQQLLPYLMEKKKKTDAEKAKQEKITKVSQLLNEVETNTVIPYSREANKERRTQAFSELASMGVNLPVSKLQDKTNLDKYFDKVKAQQWVRDAYNNGDIDFKEAMKLAKEKGEQVPFDAEQAQILIDMNLSPYDNPDDLVNYVTATNTLKESGIPVEQINKFFSPKNNNIDPNLLSSINKIDSSPRVLTREDFSAREWGALLDTYKTVDKVESMLGKQYDISKVIKIGNDVVKSEQEKLWPLNFGFDSDIMAWITGTLSNKSKKDFFENYYNKDGSTNFGAVSAVGYEAFSEAEKIIQNRGEQEAVELPVDIREPVLYLISNNITKSQFKQLYEEYKKELNDPYSTYEPDPMFGDITEDQFNKMLEYLDE